jgi:hypothetical protein
MKNFIKNQINKLPYIRGLYHSSKNTMYPNGHFYSPVIDIEEVKSLESYIYRNVNIDGVKDIDLNSKEQLKLIEELSGYYRELPYQYNQKANFRYYYNNKYFSYNDGIILYLLLRKIRPNRVIEVGSGFSSAIMLDVNEHNLNYKMNLVFIEPYPEERLLTLIKSQDKDRARIIKEKVQKVDFRLFEELETGDMLFVDTTHVTKTGGDLNHILFDLLPVLKKGVWIHFHDIYYPFEYRKNEVFKGLNWNEAYLIRAFLMNNSSYRLRLFNDYIKTIHPEAYDTIPLCNQCEGGSLWIEKC